MILEDPNYQIVNTAFPHIGHKLRLLWGTDLCSTYIHQTLMDTRGGTRQGFPVDVAKALLAIALEHDRQFPPSPTGTTDVWGRGK